MRRAFLSAGYRSSPSVQRDNEFVVAQIDDAEGATLSRRPLYAPFAASAASRGTQDVSSGGIG
jgi:hypothetical protein